MLERSIHLLFLILVVIAMPYRAWWRWHRRRPPAPVVAYLFETALLITALLITLRQGKIPFESVGLRAVEIPAFCLHTLCGVFLIVAPDVIVLHLRRFGPRSLKSGEGARFEAIPRGKAAISFIPVCIVGAFWENLCFRGTALYLAPPGVAATAIAICASSFLFGLHHFRGGPLSVMFSTCFGILLCLLYVSTQDLVSVMAAQALANLAVVFYFAPKARQRVRTVQGLF